MPASPSPITTRVVNGVSVSEILAEDERALHAAAPWVRVAVVSDTAVSYGAGVAEDAPFLERCHGDGVPVVRRGSGGTGILHSRGDLVWSIVLPRSDPRFMAGYVRAYRQFGDGLVRLFAARQLRADWGAPPALSREYCPLGDRGEVLTIRDRVVSGASQHVTPQALLHHGTLPAAVNVDQVGWLFAIDDPATLGRLAGLRELGIRAANPALAEELARAIGDALNTPG